MRCMCIAKNVFDVLENMPQKIALFAKTFTFLKKNIFLKNNVLIKLDIK